MKTRPAVSLLSVIVVLVLVLTGCGLPSDSEPRPIAQDAIPGGLESADSIVPATAPSGRTENVWVVQTVETEDGTTSRLAPLPIETGEDPETMDLLNALLEADPAEINEALSTAIPDELRLDLKFDGRTAIILLGEEFENVEGEPQKLAFAQLVYTATQLGSVDAVEFRTLDGEETIPVPTDDDSKVRVDRDDFEQFAPEVGEKADKS